MGGGLPLTAVNDIINLLARGRGFVLIDREFIPNGPLPKFEGRVLTIAKAFRVVQVFFLFYNKCARIGRKAYNRGNLPPLGL